MPYASTDRDPVYYESHGEGPALVLVHGSGGNHAIWWQQVPYFQDRYQVITLDLPGFGKSAVSSGELTDAVYPEAIIAVMDDAGIDRAVVIAGMGAALALTLAVEHPDRIAGAAVTHSIRGIADESLQTMVRSDRAAARSLTAADRLFGKDFQENEAEKKFLFEQIGTLNQVIAGEGGTKQTLEVTVEQVTDAIHAGVDVSFLRSTGDIVCLPPTYDRLKELIPEAHIEVMDGSHSVYWEVPEVFNKTVDRILERSYAAARA